ncbi:hypothetical protein XppCFBP6982P_23715 [Xanthomonas phaseoli pv. phaseoli]|uniref:Secreted protein n=1 Tax=Xanthomonas campestris pv. phaseoli TaxID=317013 RepID=A0AB38E387_XANCH|nr:hypothetical protein [Xanthomonas phaseoli]QTG35346.1 hypothetical protein XppCFBP412P_23120 [Xanthomonas phaseoli pv. phaseoli]QTG35633.1 hypothetical protein XppCFBP6982P_23715 [Xanthomonas phaseoli pv. phaseoli]UZB16877.1 hypothetical protein OM949_02165 [Xanthomonas phaseoli pv. phaseoli]UZB21024.1 hypothetical protein OM947_02160 [Xanthomonas phaseoli pv. phaseoli]SON83557.1 exported hypothetical protein [Xanthomonas phaseoli pv. phaseoli]
MNKLKIFFFLLFLLASSVAYASDERGECIRNGVVVVEIARIKADEDPKILINGVIAAKGKELSVIRNSCSKYMIVMISPKSTMRDFIDFGFLASKSGFAENSDEYLPFVYSSDRTRMTYLKTMAVIRFTDDREQLEEIAEMPPKKSKFI